MKRILLTLAGVVGLLIGLGFIMPAFALWRHGSPGTFDIVVPSALGCVLMLGGAVPLFIGARGSRP